MGTLNLQHKWDFLNTYDTILISLLTSIAIGLAWFILVQVVPSLMGMFATILAAVVAISIGVLLLVDNPKGLENYFILRLVVSVILFLIAAYIIIFIILYKRRTALMRFFLEWSTKWATKNCSFILWILVYIIFTIAFSCLIFAQHLCFLSSNTPTPQSN